MLLLFLTLSSLVIPLASALSDCTSTKLYGADNCLDKSQYHPHWLSTSGGLTFTSDDGPCFKRSGEGQPVSCYGEFRFFPITARTPPTTPSPSAVLLHQHRVAAGALRLRRRRLRVHRELRARVLGRPGTYRMVFLRKKKTQWGTFVSPT